MACITVSISQMYFKGWSSMGMPMRNEIKKSVK